MESTISRSDAQDGWDKENPGRSQFQIFSTDLDGTLLGNPEATARFVRLWKRINPARLPLLVYNSGRLLDDMRKLISSGEIEEPDYLIGGIGTQIYHTRGNDELAEFNTEFGEGWDLSKVEAIVSSHPGVERQPPDFLHPYKSSWFLHRGTPETIDELRQKLRDVGLDVTVIYSSSRDLDVLPAYADKGNALRWLCNRLSIPLTQVLVAGDTSNDSSMFHLPGVRGIVVENAQPQLYEDIVELPVFHATRIHANGVIEGLEHYGLVTEADVAAVHIPFASEDIVSRGRIFDSKSSAVLTASESAFIRTGYDKAIEALQRNITPLGFSASSLEDNEVTGTDVNYRSVWARDGALTVLFSTDLDMPEIRNASRQTLNTLFKHLSPIGQIPSNVRIEDDKPDYSGVGGICSIDSGLWVIIAFYDYVRKTGDFELLDQCADKLQRAMDWLAAHDSNNDGLLEIPEAGDWTDLFGRSYNVLYDEVLWYRANVCYGRLLEFRREYKRAAGYFRHSQFIRGEILGNFWPSTQMRPEDRAKLSFADQQFSLGDTQCLISQVSPFGFSWRCDVLGNVLAFLTNVLDADRARTAFNFMWGSGVNQPGPVANIYPPVDSGDPEWRNYYTVNLLNLPHHYHNGGLWPFIGGMWVRFIYRLGYSDVALRELHRLAELNHLGIGSEWEFNEWMHGKSGRPMGKRYQAWSAASFIRACRELNVVDLPRP